MIEPEVTPEDYSAANEEVLASLLDALRRAIARSKALERALNEPPEEQETP